MIKLTILLLIALSCFLLVFDKLSILTYLKYLGFVVLIEIVIDFKFKEQAPPSLKKDILKSFLISFSLLLCTFVFPVREQILNFKSLITFSLLGSITFCFIFWICRDKIVKLVFRKTHKENRVLNSIIASSLQTVIICAIFYFSRTHNSNLNLYKLITYALILGFFFGGISSLLLESRKEEIDTYTSGSFHKYYLGTLFSLSSLILSLVLFILLKDLQYLDFFFLMLYIFPVFGFLYGIYASKKIEYQQTSAQLLSNKFVSIYLRGINTLSWGIGITLLLAYQLSYSQLFIPIHITPNKKLIDLASKYMPIIHIDSTDYLYPISFNDVKYINCLKENGRTETIKITNLINEKLANYKHPVELFKDNGFLNAKKEDTYYVSNLSKNPDNWIKDRFITSPKDTIDTYVNFNYIGTHLKITYTLAFSGNDWYNKHRGDGAMFAIFFQEIKGSYIPKKIRAYNHFQYIEKTLKSKHKRLEFYVCKGSHSTYLSEGFFENVEGIPLISLNEEVKSHIKYQNNFRIITLDNTRTNLEKWVFEGLLYWGGSPRDGIKKESDFIRLPAGNNSARMTNDPSFVFDKKKYRH